jgi:hypothetical protein
MQSEDLYIARLSLLAEIIRKLKDLSGRINSLRERVVALKKALRVLKAKLSGLDSEKKLKDLLLSIQDQLRRCGMLESDID